MNAHVHTIKHYPLFPFGYGVCECGATIRCEPGGTIKGEWHACALCSTEYDRKAGAR